MNDLILPYTLAVLVLLFFKYVIERIFRWWNWKYWYRHWYLNSLHWRLTRWWKKVLFRLTHHGALYCEKCQRPNRLNIHHVTYKRIGRERMSDLQVICFWCHRPGGGRI